MSDFYKNMKDGRDGDNDTVASIEQVNRARRVGHSLRDYMKTLLPERNEAAGKTMMRGIEGKKSHLTRAGQAADFGSNAVAVAGVGLGATSAAVATGAIGAGVTGAAIVGGVTFGVILTALTGGIAAVVIGVSALAIVFIKSAYSNRDGAHAALQPYVWSLIDGKSPKAIGSAEELYVLSGAALTLLTDGKNQIARLGPKLKYAADELKQLNDSLDRKAKRITQATIPAVAEKERKAMAAQIKSAKRKGGAIYNFTRRGVHTGNYIQAPEIISLAMKYNFSPSGTMPVLSDPFTSPGMGDDMRKLYGKAAEFYESILTIAAMNSATSLSSGQTATDTARGKMMPTNIGAYRR